MVCQRYERKFQAKIVLFKNFLSIDDLDYGIDSKFLKEFSRLVQMLIGGFKNLSNGK